MTNMKKLMFLFIFFTITEELLAQDKYQGGNGDGYASITSGTMVVSFRNEPKEDIVVYPNPAESIISIVYPRLTKEKLIIINGQGKEVMKFENRVDKIDLSNLKPGIYYLQFGEINRKIIKK